MKKTLFILVCALAGTVMFTACSGKFSPSSEHCSPSYIKQVADTEGLDKAKKLSSDCIAAGFDSAEQALRNAGDAIKEAGNAIKDAGSNLKKELFGQ